MESKYLLQLAPQVKLQQVHQYLREHVIMYAPPYDLRRILVRYQACGRPNRPVQVIISHSSRTIHLLEPDLNHHVLQTVLSGFSNFRLPLRRPPRRPILLPDPVPVPGPVPDPVPVPDPDPVPDPVCLETTLPML